MPPYYWQSYICRGPQSLWQWDQIEAENRHKREPESEPLPYVDGYLPEPASAIRLARECDIPHILPAAFYHLSRLSIYDDWAEARQCLDIHSSRYEGLDLGRRTAKWSLLTANDFISLPKGRAKLRVAAAERRVFELDNHESEDHSSSGCSSLKRSELLLEIRKACRYYPPYHSWIHGEKRLQW